LAKLRREKGERLMLNAGEKGRKSEKCLEFPRKGGAEGKKNKKNGVAYFQRKKRKGGGVRFGGACNVRGGKRSGEGKRGTRGCLGRKSNLAVSPKVCALPVKEGETRREKKQL